MIPAKLWLAAAIGWLLILAGVVLALFVMSRAIAPEPPAEGPCAHLETAAPWVRDACRRTP